MFCIQLTNNMKALLCSCRYIIDLVTFQRYRYVLYNTRSCPLTTRQYPRIFGWNTPFQQDFQVMLITPYKEANQLQSSCISLPTATVPVVTPHMYVANQVRAHDVHFSCVVCLLFHVCTSKLRVTVPAQASF